MGKVINYKNIQVDDIVYVPCRVVEVFEDNDVGFNVEVDNWNDTLETPTFALDLTDNFIIVN